MAAINQVDLQRWHSAARMIEDDLDEAFRTVSAKYGTEVAGLLLVAALRRQLNDNPNQWPPPENLIPKVNAFLVEKGLYDGG